MHKNWISVPTISMQSLKKTLISRQVRSLKTGLSLRLKDCFCILPCLLQKSLMNSDLPTILISENILRLPQDILPTYTVHWKRMILSKCRTKPFLSGFAHLYIIFSDFFINHPNNYPVHIIFDIKFIIFDQLMHIPMKNLKKISRIELSSINGGIETCLQNCPVGLRKCCTRGKAYYCEFVQNACV